MNKINKLIEKISEEQLTALQQLKRDPAKVVSVLNRSKATVRFLNGTEAELLNKTGELLAAGDDVWVEYRTVPSGGYIAMRNGETRPMYSALYSEYEHRVGTWIDGSELYEKTFEISSLGDSGNRSVAVSLGIDNLKEIIESRGQLLGSGFSRPLECMPIGSDGASAEPGNATSYSLSATELTVYNGTTDRSGCKAYVTIRYTKLQNTPPTEITWIKSTGSQYIDTDIYLNSALHRVEIDCEFTDFIMWDNMGQTGRPSPFIFGAALSESETPSEESIGYGASIYFSYVSYDGGYKLRVNAPASTAQSRRVIVYDAVESLNPPAFPTSTVFASRGKITCQSAGFAGWTENSTDHGGQIGSGADATTYYPIRLFGAKRGGANDAVFEAADMTLYGIKIYDKTNNDELVHDLVPAVGSGTAGVYDRVTGIFYGNGSSTPFATPT